MSQDNSIKQCILIAESIDSDFHSASPFLKVGNDSAIDLVIMQLCDHGISEIFLYHNKSKERLLEYANNIQKSCSAKLHFNYIKPEQMSLGQVLRDVMFHNLVGQDFLIMYADTVTNIDFGKAFAFHAKKKAASKLVCLTSVLRQGGASNLMHITSESTGEILQVEALQGDKNFVLNPDRINMKKMNVEFRRDLTHCDIYICTTEVLKSFKENFELNTMLEFISRILSTDVYEDKIIAHILEQGELAFRINTSRDYYRTSLNYICRHFHPFSLFNTFKKPKWDRRDQAPYSSRPFNKILANSADISHSAQISKNCLIGEKTEVGDNVVINKCIVGNNCRIESDVTIANCIILDNCIVQKGLKYENCLIENVDSSSHIKYFADPVGAGGQTLVTHPLFLETPPQEETNFEEELGNLLAQDPDIEIVSELYSVRKHYNKTLDEFTKQMLSMLSPQGIKGVNDFCEKWGQIILKLHESQKLVLDSLYFSCNQLTPYRKAFNIFVQYFYHLKLLSSFQILQWFDNKLEKEPESQVLLKCCKFMDQLRHEDHGSESSEESQEEEGEGEESKSQDSSN